MATVSRGGKQNRYLELVAAFPLRPISNDAQYRRAVKVLDALLDQSKLSRDERDYLEVLGDVVEKYEEKFEEIAVVSDAQMLEFLIESREITQTEVARATGIPNSVLSNVLHGKRELNRGQIAKLTKYFHVSPTVFDLVSS